MEIKRHRALHGWVFEITDHETKEKWMGNICKTIKEAKEQAIASFIEDRKRLIKAGDSVVNVLFAQIVEAEKL